MSGVWQGARIGKEGYWTTVHFRRNLPVAVYSYLYHYMRVILHQRCRGMEVEGIPREAENPLAVYSLSPYCQHEMILDSVNEGELFYSYNTGAKDSS